MLPLFPSDTRDQIEQIIDMIGRTVTFYGVESLSGCQYCSLDPITDTSTDSYCPVCSGNYWIAVYSGWDVTAHVTWGKTEDKAWMTGGMIDNGDIMVKVMHTPEAEETVLNAEYVVVDGRELDIKNITIRGVPEVNRILVNLKEKEK